jgi:membrane-associated protease RseP (regulator of RpoE activity)
MKPRIGITCVAVVALTLAGALPAAAQQPGQPTPTRTAPLNIGPYPGGPASDDAASSRRWLGLGLTRAGEALAMQLGLEAGQGWLVEEVFPDSAAAKAGIQRHDVLVAVHDTPLHRVAELLDAVKTAGDGPINVELVRAGKRQTVEVVPQEVPVQTQDPYAFRNVALGWSRGGLPDDVEVTITKRGKGLARIRVQRGREVWEIIDGDSLERFPDDLREPLAAFLSRATPPSVWAALTLPQVANPSHGRNTARWETGPRQTWGSRAPTAGPSNSADLENRLAEILDRLERIEKELADDEAEAK